MADSGNWIFAGGTTLGHNFKAISTVLVLVEEGDSKVKWEFSKICKHRSSWSKACSFAWKVPIILPALQKTRIIASLFEGSAVELPFSAQIQYTLDYGYTFYTLVSGTYDRVSSCLLLLINSRCV